MKKIILLSLGILAACSSPIDEPKNLVPQDKMAELVAELAIADQLGILNPSGDMRLETIYTLRTYNITPKQFSDSYKFYLVQPDKLNAIYDGAQEIIRQKDPAAAAYIDKRLHSNTGPASLPK